MVAKKKKNELKIVYRKVTDLVPCEYNAKIHEDYDIGVIAKNIETMGFLVPFIIDKDNVIVCGHGRRLAIMKLGRENEEFPCVYADDLTPEQIDTFRLSENISNEKAGYDYEIFDEVLGRLKDLGVDLPPLGFDNFDDVMEDDDPEPPVEAPQNGPGDIKAVEVDDDTGTGKETIVCPHCGKVIEL